MSFCRIHRRFATWLAMWVMVLSALAPTVAQAMVAASEKDQWVEVCSASGMVWLKADGAGATGDAAPAQGKSVADLGKHCPWCGFHGAATGLPPAMTSEPPLAGAAQAVAEPSPVVLRGRVLRSAQARAPPSAS